MKRRRRVMPKQTPRRGPPRAAAGTSPGARPTTHRARGRVTPCLGAIRARPDLAAVADAAVAGAARVAGLTAVTAEAMARPAARGPTLPRSLSRPSDRLRRMTSWGPG